MYSQDFIGKTYGDVLIPPYGQNIAESRKDISLRTKFSKNTPMNQPIVSANMLDVTESEMAIACSLNGGLGVIHRFCPIDFEAEEIKKVKRAQNFIIHDPYKIKPSARIAKARDVMRKHNINSLLVYEEPNRLVGILTERDMRFRSDNDPVANRMTPRKDLRLLREGDIPSEDSPEALARVTEIFSQTKLKKLPIVSTTDEIKGLICSKDVVKREKYNIANVDSAGRLVVGAAIGAVGDYLERAEELVKAGTDVLVIDVTSCHSVVVEKAIREVRKKLGSIELVVGNAGTSEQANFLIRLGVDGIKIGIGPGGLCTTRMSTGIGVPQLFAVMEIYWNLIYKYNHHPDNIPPLCADGNIHCGADIFHALMAGASSVMMGSLLAATKETPGTIYPKEDGEYKRIRGMASREALVARYEADGEAYPIAKAMEKNATGSKNNRFG